MKKLIALFVVCLSLMVVNSAEARPRVLRKAAKATVTCSKCLGKKMVKGVRGVCKVGRRASSAAAGVVGCRSCR